MERRIIVTIRATDEHCGECQLYVIDGMDQLCCAFGDGFLGVDRTPRIRLQVCRDAETYQPARGDHE